jgi:glycosyltransferase involved in cell wall biosynthesis
MKRLAFASHAAYIEKKEYDGIANVLIEALSAENFTYTMVRHSIDGRLLSVVRAYKNKAIQEERGLFVIKRPAPIRYISEFFSTVAYFTFMQKVDIYVGIDPLNALVAVVLQKLHRIERSIFYTPDYSPRRFNNTVLNSIYHAIDRYCVRHSDEVWCVSGRIQQVRRDMGLAEDKNILIPNVPPAKFDYLRNNQHGKQTLITYGIIDKQLDFEGPIRALATLKHKYPHIRLVIVGNGPEEPRLKILARSLHVSDRVDFMGRQPLAETLKLASTAGIGLSLYTGAWEFNTYGDSTKCREYAYFGLPILSTDSHATVEEIRSMGAGIIVAQDVMQYVEAITTILDNYKKYSTASAKLGKKYYDIHRQHILRLVQK